MKLSSLGLLVALTVTQNALAQNETPVPGSASDLAAALMKQKLAKANQQMNAEPSLGGTHTSPGPSVTESAAKMAGMAIALAGLLFGISMVVRKLRNNGNEPAASTMKVLESLWLSKSQRLLLVSVRGEKVLIGASGGALHNLAVLPKPALTPRPKAHPEPDSEPARADEPDTKVEAKKLEFADLVKGEMTRSVVEDTEAAEVPAEPKSPSRRRVRGNRNRILHQLNSL